MRLIYHNLIGVIAIALGCYLLLNDYKLLTIIVGAIGLAVVLRGMKVNMSKPLSTSKGQLMQNKASKKKK